ncbi:MAG TPA: phosphodiester glycosidase family protein [Actinomycetota bacterium]|nr:phosphodiester glycosidase family protein [Actinomycetota bacterium]
MRVQTSSLRSAARARRSVVLSIAVLLSVLSTAYATPAPALDAGSYRVETFQPLAPGVEYQRLVRDSGPVVAHVVGIQQSPTLQLTALLSNDRVAGPVPTTEPTSSMCRRVNCIAAVNGDFFHSSGEPVGAVAHTGRLLRSPENGHDQVGVMAAGGLYAGPVAWSGRISSNSGSLDLIGVNRAPAEGVTLYTPDYGPSTPAASPGAELVVRILQLPHPLGLAETGLVQLVGLTESSGGTAIPTGGAVLLGQGPGADRLRELWRSSQANLLGQTALLQLGDSPSLLDSVGGSPILLRGGQVAVSNDDPRHDLVRGLHPRTLVGWNANKTFLVVVDGRQPGYSVGMNLLEAAELLRHLGASDGINLDGGGSATLVVGGIVVNRPSDRLVVRDGVQRIVAVPQPGDTVIGPVERPVANGLAVVAATPLSILGNLLGTELVTPPAGIPPAAPQDDPGSRPG